METKKPANTRLMTNKQSKMVLFKEDHNGLGTTKHRRTMEL